MFHNLKKKGKFMDGFTYSVVIPQLCKEGHLQEVLSFVQEMEARGFKVDLVTITSLLIGFFKHSWWDGTNTLLKHLRDKSCPCFNNTLMLPSDSNLVMNAPSKIKDGTRMFESEGNISEFVKLMSPALVESEVFYGGDSDEWSSSPHMDR
ncbi:hypothetical protein MLD38_039685 [Melastoma candidum]|uniref:Uncharacterized protein n=1 Tax=Melastoma candidum TaxID=119954 RepID=A0ACB9L3L5_9MYRT|nr:hypothetical protein MLD38_039685 [Melastoma candidum]